MVTFLSPPPTVCPPQLSKKDHGEYKATLKDDRGQDVSTLEIAGKGAGRLSVPPRGNPFHPRERRVGPSPRPGPWHALQFSSRRERHEACPWLRVGRGRVWNAAWQSCGSPPCHRRPSPDSEAHPGPGVAVPGSASRRLRSGRTQGARDGLVLVYGVDGAVGATPHRLCGHILPLQCVTFKRTWRCPVSV